jgi:cysteine desulfurase
VNVPDEIIYLDHHATTPCDERVVAAMLPYFSRAFGNAAAITHPHGREAAKAVEESRRTVADHFGVDARDVIFTSGATEANNLAIFGSIAASGRRHLVTSAIEHSSVIRPLRELEKRGCRLTVVPPSTDGRIAPQALADAITDDTALISIGMANGEIGTIQPWREIAEVCEARGVRLHTDATQAVGKIAFDGDRRRWSLLSLSAHKFYGPKGIGALIVKSGTYIEPVELGGGQERGLRSGTVNVPAVVGLAEAIRLRSVEMDAEAALLSALRDELLVRLREEFPGLVVHGTLENRLPGNLNVSFPHVNSEDLLELVRGFSLSSGSACSAGRREPSSVLSAIGASEKTAIASIRFGLGKSNTRAQIPDLIRELRRVVSRLGEMEAV